MGPLELGLDPASECDGFARMRLHRVPHEPMQRVDREHPSIALPGLRGAVGAFRASLRVGTDEVPDLASHRVPLKCSGVVLLVVGHQEQRPVARFGYQEVELAVECDDVGVADRLSAPPVPPGLFSPLGRGQMAPASMGGETEAVHEPRVVADARPEAAGVVLRAGERLEVIVVEGFVKSGQPPNAKAVQQLGMPAETSDTLGHGAGSTSGDSGDLPVSGAVDDALSDRNGQFGTLEVITHRKRLLGKAATASQTDESGNDPTVAESTVGRTKPLVAERRGLDPMLRAAGARAEPWCELIVRDDLDLGARPVHEREIRQAACRTPETELALVFAGTSAPRPPQVSARGQ